MEINKLFNQDFKKTIDNITKWIKTFTNYKDLLENEVFKKLFPNIIKSYDNKNVQDYFNDDNHRLNYLKIFFKSNQNNLETIFTTYHVLQNEWKKYYKNKCAKEKTEPILIHKIVEYYGKIGSYSAVKNHFDITNGQKLCSNISQTMHYSEIARLLFKSSKVYDKSNMKIYNYSNYSNNNIPLNAQQLLALQKVHEKKIVNIQGPPGTGKTTLIKDIITSLYLNNQTVCIASYNNHSVDDIYNAFSNDLFLKNIPFLRLGNYEKITNTCENLIKMIENKKFLEVKNNILINAKGIEKELQKLQTLAWIKENRKEKHKFLQDVLLNDFLLEQILKKENPIWYIKAVMYQLKEWDSIINQKKSFILSIYNFFKTKILLRRLKFINIKPFEINFSLTRKAIIDQIKYILSTLNNLLNYFEEEEQYKDLDKKIKVILKAIHSSTKNTEALFSIKNNAILKEAKNKIKRLKIEIASTEDQALRNKKIISKIKDNDFRKAFPITFTTTTSIDNSFNESVTIDYLIIDEAAQTNIHSILGSLYKFKNLILLGDTKQLPTVVNLDQEVEKVIANEAKLDDEYRNINNSIPKIIERTLSNELSIMLNDHWRCLPSIANFFNEEYYESQLNIKRIENELEANEAMLFKIYEDGDFADFWQKIKVKYDKYLISEKQEIALMSPFNYQKSYPKLFNKIQKNSGIHQIGTTHSFQGYEKSVIIYFINNEPMTNFKINDFLNKSCLINVATSRAKNKFHIYIGRKTYDSLKKYSKPNNELLKLIDYIKYLNAPNTISKKIRNSLNLVERNKYSFSQRKINALSEDFINELIKENLFFTFGVRDIDVDLNINLIENSIQVYDLVIFNNEAIIVWIINFNNSIYENKNYKIWIKEAKRKFYPDIKRKIQIESTKAIMSRREMWWWNKVKLEINNKDFYIKSKKDGIMWLYLPCISYSKLFHEPYAQIKFHSDLTFASGKKEKNLIVFKYLTLIEIDDSSHQRKVVMQRDKLKNNYCINKNINLIRFQI